MILGAVLAGGAARRFGSDKALALYKGKPLIDHAIARLGEIARTVVVCGGERSGYVTIPDVPIPGLGPLGGLCGAIEYARANDFAGVLTMPCDTPDLPVEGLRMLADLGSAAYLRRLPVAGYWPVALHDALLDQLTGEDRSMRAWVVRCGAEGIDSPEVTNVNCPSDLPALSAMNDGQTPAGSS